MWGRAESGVKIIDDLITNGLPVPSTVLVLGDPGSGKSTLCQQFLSHNLKNGGNGIYVAYEEHPEDICRTMHNFGWYNEDLEKSGRLFFIDSTSVNPSDYNTLNLKLTEALEKMKNGEAIRIVIDSLTALFSAGTQEFRLGLDFIRNINAKVRNYGSLCLYTLNRKGFDEETTALVKDVSDGVIELKMEEELGLLRSYIRVLKMRGTDHSRRWMPYSIDSNKGLTFYIPRILVVGPEESGKSTIMKHFKARRWKVGDFEAEAILCETLDSSFVKATRSKDISGILLVIDSTRPESFPEALETLAKIETPGLPVVVLANKQDLPGAITPENAKEEMGLPKEIPVLGAVGTEGVGVEEVVRTLIKNIVKLPV